MLTMAIPDVEIYVFLVAFGDALIYSPDGTYVYGSRRGEFEERG